MTLFERIYQVSRRTFWHGSTSEKPFEKLEAQVKYNQAAGLKPGPPVLFVSYDHFFSVKFAASERKANTGPFYVYELRFIKDPNIFNPTTGHDIQRLIKYLTNKWEDDMDGFHEEFSTDPNFTVEDYVKTLRFREWDSVENGALLFTLIEMGYDGFTTLERRKNHLGLFNADLVKIVDREEFISNKDGIFQRDHDSLNKITSLSSMWDNTIIPPKDNLDNRINKRGDDQRMRVIRTLRTDRDNPAGNRFRTRDMNADLR
jgi:hypothetical protein